MSVENRFSQHYKEGTAPWDIGKPDFNLMQIVSATPIAPCKALEIGCGTGDNALWLSENGFDVVGVDGAGIAIEKARGKASQTGRHCRFVAMNFLEGQVEGSPFGFA